MPADEFVSRPHGVQLTTIRRDVGLADVRPDATMRTDAIARVLQDVADRDAADAALTGGGVWVLRRMTVRVHHTPRFRAGLDLVTWCSGVGRMWAERRTDVLAGDLLAVEAAAIWVHVDPERGVPAPRPDGFDARWGATAAGRAVSARLRLPEPPPAGARHEPWPLRAADLDVLGHVNNAAYWAPVEEELARRGRPRVVRAEMEFRAGLDAGDAVTCVLADRDDGFAMWLCAAGEVRGSALVGCAP